MATPAVSSPAGLATSAEMPSSSAGGSWRMRWALVPLTPNADTPARRGCPAGGQGTAPVSSRTDPDDQSTCGEGSSACNVGGSTPCCSASTILITPATPAADWV